MEKIQVQSSDAPKPGGPYSQAILVKNASKTIHISGQLGIDVTTGKLVEGGIEAEFEQIMQNIKAILTQAEGANFDHLVKINCYMADLDEFQTMNKIYEKYFNQSKPARTTFQAARLPLAARIEIDAVAMI